MNDAAIRSRLRQTGWSTLSYATFFILVTASSARAASFSALAGYDYYDGVEGQITRGAVAAVAAGFAGAQASLAGVRYDDDLWGQGTSVTAGLGVPLGLLTTLRAQGTRFVGDETYRAWRAKVGPQVGLPGGRTIGLWYSHYEDNEKMTSDGVIVESEIPLVEKLSARVSGSYATMPQGVHGLQGTVGLGWALVPHLQLSADVGVAQNGGAAAAAPGPVSRRLTLPLIGGGGGSGTSSSPSNRGFFPTALLGFRVSIP